MFARKCTIVDHGIGPCTASCIHGIVISFHVSKLVCFRPVLSPEIYTFQYCTLSVTFSKKSLAISTFPNSILLAWVHILFINCYKQRILYYYSSAFHYPRLELSYYLLNKLQKNSIPVPSLLALEHLVS